MADPFGALRAPVTPADPDPGFAARLRARLERALGLPEGVSVSDISPPGALGQKPHPAPVAAIRRRGAWYAAPGGTAGQSRGGTAGGAPPRPGDIGYASLWLPDAGRAAAFYAAVLGWEYGSAAGPGGRQVPGTAPPQGLQGGRSRPTLFCSYLVDDAAAAAARVRAAGGLADEPVPRPYGLVADCADGEGTRFAVHQPPAADAGGDVAVPAATGPASRRVAHDGDLAYVSLEVTDSRQARDFYGAVLGWRFVPGRVADGWQVVGTTPLIGLSGGHHAATAVPMWRVGDLAAAVRRVRAAGGSATAPRQEPYGLMADCTDDQGTRFYLGQFPDG